MIIIPFAAAAMILETFEPEGALGHLLHILAGFVLIACGAAGAMGAMLERGGFIRFHYTENEKQGFQYRMARQLAEREHGQGLRYSACYYENYGITPQNRDEAR